MSYPITCYRWLKGRLVRGQQKSLVRRSRIQDTPGFRPILRLTYFSSISTAYRNYSCKVRLKRACIDRFDEHQLAAKTSIMIVEGESVYDFGIFSNIDEQIIHQQNQLNDSNNEI